MIDFSDIQSARERVSPYIRRTPLFRSENLTNTIGVNLYLKMEILQKTGSFKPRGAFNQILQLGENERKKGVVAVSGGNFAQGVAFAGSKLGINTVICMPEYTPQHYIRGTKDLGAIVEIVPDYGSTFTKAEEYINIGYTFLHAWDNHNQMAGNGTIGVEIIEDLPQVTDIFISIGGGGLLTGIAIAVKFLKPDTRIWGVETRGSETMGKALEAGRVVEIEPTSIARTLGAPYIAEDALYVGQNHLEDYLVVTDQEAIESQRVLLEEEKVLTELAASCTHAAWMKVRDHFTEDDHVVLLLCGGNETLENIKNYIE